MEKSKKFRKNKRFFQIFHDFLYSFFFNFERLLGGLVWYVILICIKCQSIIRSGIRKIVIMKGIKEDVI